MGRRPSETFNHLDLRRPSQVSLLSDKWGSNLSMDDHISQIRREVNVPVGSMSTSSYRRPSQTLLGHSSTRLRHPPVPDGHLGHSVHSFRYDTDSTFPSDLDGSTNSQYSSHPRSGSITPPAGKYGNAYEESKVRKELELVGLYPIEKYLQKACPVHAKKLMADKYVYPMSKPLRGRTIIINNEWYGHKDHMRSGSAIDRENLENLFSQLYFQTEAWESLTSKEIKRSLERERQSEDHRNAQAFVLVVLSHGEKGHVVCSDGKKISIEYITSCFDGNRCPDLRGKPKLFIIQACQTDEMDEGAKKKKIIKGTAGTEKADSLVVYATVPGHVALRYDTLGSLFIREFVLNVMLHADTTHMEDILQKVRRQLATVPEAVAGETQLSKVETTLLYPWYLFPGYQVEDEDRKDSTRQDTEEEKKGLRQLLQKALSINKKT